MIRTTVKVVALPALIIQQTGVTAVRFRRQGSCTRGETQGKEVKKGKGGRRPFSRLLGNGRSYSRREKKSHYVHIEGKEGRRSAAQGARGRKSQGDIDKGPGHRSSAQGVRGRKSQGDINGAAGRRSSAQRARGRKSQGDMKEGPGHRSSAQRARGRKSQGDIYTIMGTRVPGDGLALGMIIFFVFGYLVSFIVECFYGVAHRSIGQKLSEGEVKFKQAIPNGLNVVETAEGAGGVDNAKKDLQDVANTYWKFLDSFHEVVNSHKVANQVLFLFRTSLKVAFFFVDSFTEKFVLKSGFVSKIEGGMYVLGCILHTIFQDPFLGVVDDEATRQAKEMVRKYPNLREIDKERYKTLVITIQRVDKENVEDNMEKVDHILEMINSRPQNPRIGF